MEEFQNNAVDIVSRVKRNGSGRNTLILVGVIFIILGVGGSYVASKAIENFFWEVHAKSATQTVVELHNELKAADMSHWQEAETVMHLEVFAEKIKQYLPNIAAVKIYTLNGAIAWTDIQNIQQGYREPEIESELEKVIAGQQFVKAASESTKKQLGRAELLEVWATLRDPQGQPAGYIELYLDSGNILLFIKKLQYSVWGTMTFVLAVILILLRLTFRKQSYLIAHQAQELSNVVEKSPVGIYIINQKGIITTINKKMLELINEKDARKVIGQEIFTLPAVQKLGIDDLIRKALLGESFKKELACADKNCESLYQYYQATPLFADNQKTVEQVLLTVEDITNQKKLEASLAEQAKGLEALVTERTNKLKTKIDELEQFQRVTVDRELRMTELKQQIENMRIKLEELGVKMDTV